MRYRTARVLASVLLAAALLGAATRVDAPSRTRPIVIPAAALARVHPGDLIFREGTELVSDAVMAAEQDGGYSHVGMLLRGPGGWAVIHAVPAERPGRKDAVVMDDLAFFDAPARARAVALYHVNATAAQRAQARAYARAHLGEPFGFESGETYCTRFVLDAWSAAGVDLHAHFTSLHVPFLPDEYLLPSSLRASSGLHFVWSSRRTIQVATVGERQH